MNSISLHLIDEIGVVCISFNPSYCLFATHLHELAAEIDRINEQAAKQGGVKIDTLVAGIEEGERSFKIYRAKPDGKSYARDIAERYGLTYDNILKKIGK